MARSDVATIGVRVIPVEDDAGRVTAVLVEAKTSPDGYRPVSVIGVPDTSEVTDAP